MTTSLTINDRLKALGIELPVSNPPAANYVPYVVTGNLIYVSGQTCKWNGVVQYAGKVGREFTVEEGKQAARMCGLNVLLQLKGACGGDLENVTRCVKLNVYIHATDVFDEQSQVANGVSDLMVDVFGEKGRHARTSVSCNSLPLQSAVEVDAVFEVTL